MGDERAYGTLELTDIVLHALGDKLDTLFA